MTINIDSKINILPIICEHFGTFRSLGKRGRFLKRDFALFLGIPIVAAFVAHHFRLTPSDQFLTISLTVHTVFVPLLFNVLFVIYGIQEKRNDKPQPPKVNELLLQVYRNLSYSVLISFFSIVVTALAQLATSPTAKQLLGSAYSATYAAIVLLLYWLITHLLLTLLMIVRRTHILLSAEFSAEANSEGQQSRK